MGLVDFCHFKGLILLVQFPQSHHRYEHDSHYALGLMMPLDSSGWLWHEMVIGQKMILSYTFCY